MHIFSLKCQLQKIGMWLYTRKRDPHGFENLREWGGKSAGSKAVHCLQPRALSLRPRSGSSVMCQVEPSTWLQSSHMALDSMHEVRPDSRASRWLWTQLAVPDLVCCQAAQPQICHMQSYLLCQIRPIMQPQTLHARVGCIASDPSCGVRSGVCRPRPIMLDWSAGPIWHIALGTSSAL